MVLESFGRKFTEMELSKIVKFNPRKGLSPLLMEYICETINIKYDFHFNSSTEEIEKIVKEEFYPIVLVDPSILYDFPQGEHGHYIVVKDIRKEKIIINDPDREYGGENKEINKENFLIAWEIKHKFIFTIKGEKND